MAKCKNCNERFSYKEILKSLLITQKISCSKCATKNELELISSFIYHGLLIFIPIFIILIVNNLGIESTLSYRIYLIYLFILISISPFLVRYE